MFDLVNQIETVALAADKAIGSTENTPITEKEVIARLHSPRLGWAWEVYEAEIQGDDCLMFGTVLGWEKEMGYFTATDLKSAGAWLLWSLLDGETSLEA